MDSSPNFSDQPSFSPPTPQFDPNRNIIERSNLDSSASNSNNANGLAGCSPENTNSQSGQNSNSADRGGYSNSASSGGEYGASSDQHRFDFESPRTNGSLTSSNLNLGTVNSRPSRPQGSVEGYHFAQPEGLSSSATGYSAAKSSNGLGFSGLASSDGISEPLTQKSSPLESSSGVSGENKSISGSISGSKYTGYTGGDPSSEYSGQQESHSGSSVSSSIAAAHLGVAGLGGNADIGHESAVFEHGAESEQHLKKVYTQLGTPVTDPLRSPESYVHSTPSPILEGRHYAGREGRNRGSGLDGNSGIRGSGIRGSGDFRIGRMSAGERDSPCSDGGDHHGHGHSHGGVPCDGDHGHGHGGHGHSHGGVPCDGDHGHGHSHGGGSHGHGHSHGGVPCDGNHHSGPPGGGMGRTEPDLII
jgi:hypothetical protein